jgi:hypothetical protein
MVIEIGYDGLARSSFRKSRQKDFSNCYRVQIADMNALDAFIGEHMNR